MSAIGKDGKVRVASRYVIGRLNDWRGTIARRIRHAPITTRLHDSLLRRLTSGRPPIGLPIILLAVLAAIAWPRPAAAADCFHYGQVVTLSGQYFAKVAPADDGVVRDPLNDTARRATLLSLAAPLCVNADTVSGGVLAAMSVQLNCPAVHPVDGSELSLKGRLLGAHTGNGQTPVLLMCL